MSANFILNESLMIRDRLQDAYKEIIFIADNDFAQDENYKKAHQRLYARIKKLEENADFERPRDVRDVIPNSNLAKYGCYQYNEVREQLYKSNSTQIAVHHYSSNSKSRKECTEPWMLPEVEQIFIHTLFTGTRNFHLYEAELEHLDKLDNDSTSMAGVSTDSTKSIRLIDNLFDRAVGGGCSSKSYNALPNDVELKDTLPYYFNVQGYDDVLLKKRILSDSVKDLWRKPKLENQDKVLNIYKSSLQNLFIEEENKKYVNNIKTTETSKNLQKLVNSIVDLNDEIPKMSLITTTQSSANIETESGEKEAVAPVRRLYSDVVQGNKSAAKNSQLHIDSWPTSLNIPKKKRHFEVLKKSKYYKINTDTIMPLPTHTTESSPTNSPCKFNILGEDTFEEHLSTNAPDSPDSTTSMAQSRRKSRLPEARSKAHMSNNAQNLPLTDFPIYDTRNNPATTYQSFYNPIAYLPGIYSNPMYRIAYPSTSYHTAAVAAAGNFIAQQLGTQRTTLATGKCPQHQWSYQSCRQSNLCSFGNFLGQLLVPQMPPKPRWPNAHYARSPTAQTIYQPINQTWAIPNVYRSTSVQHMSVYQLYEAQRAVKVKKSTAAAANSTGKYTRSKTPDSEPITSKKKILTKPSSDFKLMSRSVIDESVPSTSSSTARPYDVDTSIPISCTASDELEKIALREYQSSNDMFFTEIERQATEQYDDRANRTSPLYSEHPNYVKTIQKHKEENCSCENADRCNKYLCRNRIF